MRSDSHSGPAQRLVEMLQVVLEGIEIQQKGGSVDFVHAHSECRWRRQGAGLTSRDGSVVHGESTQMFETDTLAQLAGGGVAWD